jgi:hypothetical protein
VYFKSANNEPGFVDRIPAGSRVIMNKESACMNSNIFMTWLKEHFLPRKASGKVLLVLDGHASHCNEFEMLDFARSNDIVLFMCSSYY